MKTISISSSTAGSGQAISVVIPAQPLWHRLVFILFLLMLCAWMEWGIMSEIWSGKVEHQRYLLAFYLWSVRQQYVFAFFWCALIAVVGAGTAGFYVWMLLGREVIRVTPSTLSLRNELGRMGWSRAFAVDRVGTIHVTPPASTWRVGHHHDSLRPGVFKQGEIEFDFDAVSFRFGFDLDDDAALKLLRAIAKVLPTKTVLPA